MSAGDKPFVVRVSPAGRPESFNGFLLRATSMNGVRDPSWLLRMGRRAARSSDPSDFLKIAHLTGAAVDALDSVTGPDAALPNDVIDVVHPRICTACLSKQPWARRVWDVHAVVACPDHGTLLLDVCPGCGERLTWRRPELTRCRCGQDLLAVPRPEAASSLVKSAAVLAALMEGRSPPERCAPVRDAASASRLLWFFASDAVEDGVGW